MQKKTQEKRKNWDWKKRLNVLIAALFLSIVSVMISLCLFAITHLIFKHFSETVETIDSIIPTTILLDSTKLWFFAFISASVIFCVCLRILNDYIEIVKNEQKTIDIFKKNLKILKMFCRRQYRFWLRRDDWWQYLFIH